MRKCLHCLRNRLSMMIAIVYLILLSTILGALLHEASTLLREGIKLNIYFLAIVMVILLIKILHDHYKTENYWKEFWKRRKRE